MYVFPRFVKLQAHPVELEQKARENKKLSLRSFGDAWDVMWIWIDGLASGDNTQDTHNTHK